MYISTHILTPGPCTCICAWKHNGLSPGQSGSGCTEESDQLCCCHPLLYIDVLLPPFPLMFHYDVWILNLGLKLILNLEFEISFANSLRRILVFFFSIQLGQTRENIISLCDSTLKLTIRFKKWALITIFVEDRSSERDNMCYFFVPPMSWQSRRQMKDVSWRQYWPCLIMTGNRLYSGDTNVNRKTVSCEL